MNKRTQIESVVVMENNKVQLKLMVSNTDSINYYFLNPETTDMSNYHFYATWLFIADIQNKKIYGNNVHPVSAPRESDWLGVIESGESKSITVSYDNFDTVSPGEYTAIFRFPGLTVGKSMLEENNGIIWSGQIYLTKEIRIE